MLSLRVESFIAIYLAKSLTIPFCARYIASTSACSTGELRLVNGDGNSNGRVETCLGGIWGTICNIGWDDEDAASICQSLGYSSGGACVHVLKLVHACMANCYYSLLAIAILSTEL